MPRIVISYRREDSPGMALAIFNRLEGRYGPNTIFMDVDIPFGTDFRNHIDEVLQDCDILIAIVGRKWLGAGRGGHLRIKDDDDWVRLEVETALGRGIAVIPALVDGAGMPAKDQLPENLDIFRFRQAATVDSGRNFFPQMDLLMRHMDHILQGKGKAPPEARSETKEASRAEIPAPPLTEPQPPAAPAVEKQTIEPDQAPQRAPETAPPHPDSPPPLPTPETSTPLQDADQTPPHRVSTGPSPGLPAPVRVISILLIALGVVRLGFIANNGANSSTSYASYTADRLVLNLIIPIALNLGVGTAGFLALMRSAAARPFGLTICTFGFLFQLYGAGSIVYFYATHPTFTPPWNLWALVPSYLLIQAAALIIFARWRPGGTKR